MGGSFNPVHYGHIALARAALEGGYAHEVVFLPTGNPPHKTELAPKLCRFDMVRLGIEGEMNMSVSREEIDRDGVIYTVDTLENLMRAMPGVRFVYLIGADTLRALSAWRRIDEVIARCDFLVMMREGETQQQAQALAAHWTARGAVIRFLSTRKMDVSSTQIRRRVAAGESIRGLTPPAVCAYIHDHGLYMSGS